MFSRCADKSFNIDFPLLPATLRIGEIIAP
jgi:hypothetical protein